MAHALRRSNSARTWLCRSRAWPCRSRAWPCRSRAWPKVWPCRSRAWPKVWPCRSRAWLCRSRAWPCRSRAWPCRSRAWPKVWPCRSRARVLSRMVSANTSISWSRRRPACRIWTKPQKIAPRPSPLRPSCAHMPMICCSILSSGEATHLIRRVPVASRPGHQSRTSRGFGPQGRPQSQDSLADRSWRSPGPGQSGLRCTNTRPRLSR